MPAHFHRSHETNLIIPEFQVGPLALNKPQTRSEPGLKPDQQVSMTEDPEQHMVKFSNIYPMYFCDCRMAFQVSDHILLANGLERVNWFQFQACCHDNISALSP